MCNKTQGYTVTSPSIVSPSTTIATGTLANNFNLNFKFGGAGSDSYSLETTSFQDGTKATLSVDTTCDEAQIVYSATSLIYNSYGTISVPIADMY